jgi:hypothetical protein
MDLFPPDAFALSAKLEAALLRELRATYAYENDARFRDRLTPPLLALVDGETHLGRWIPATRTLELSRKLVLGAPWTSVIDVLLHEMAHQYVHEVLRVRDETAHGMTFRQVCRERGIDARAAGAPITDPTRAAEIDRVLDRIRKLLALAESPNQHEAETAMRTAHALMLRYNLDLAAAESTREFEVRFVGDPKRRRSRVEEEIIALLTELFFVKAIRIPVYLPAAGRHGSVYELSGTHANVEMAVHVFEFLLGTAGRLWTKNRHDARIRSGHDRLSYQAGVIRGFRDKLRAEREELRGTGIVWVPDAQLDAYYHARHPRISLRRRSILLDGAHEAGREAGQKVVLHKPMGAGPSGGAPKRLGSG